MPRPDETALAEAKAALDGLNAGPVREHLLAALAALSAGAETSSDDGGAGAGAGGGATATATLPPDAVVSTGAVVANALTGAGVSPTSLFEALALALHCLLLSAGFVCVGSDAEQAKAAATAGIPGVTGLVPERWNKETGVLSFCYNHPKAAGRTLVVKFFLAGDVVHVHTGVAETGTSGAAELPLSAVFDAGAALTDLLALYTTCKLSPVVDRVSAITDDIVRTPPASSAPAPAPAAASSDRRPTREPARDPLRVPPMPGTLPINSDPLHAGGVGGSGLLVGPDHPMFGGGGGGMMGPPGVPPGARFDPYGPGVPDPGFPGGGFGPGRGGRGGRGPAPFGGPRPDHLRPPGPGGPSPFGPGGGPPFM